MLGKTRPKRKPKRKSLPYPENLMYDILVEDVAWKNPDHKLRDDQLAALSEAIETLETVEREILDRRYRMTEVYRVIGEAMNLSQGKCLQICSRALRKLRNPAFSKFYR